MTDLKKTPKRDKVFVEHQYRQNVFDLFTLCSHSCCGEYGHIYKPDRPISATDLQIKQVGQLEKKNHLKLSYTGVCCNIFFVYTNSNG